MRSTSDIASSLIAWATTVLPEIQSTHDFPHQEDPGPLPDLAVDVTQVRQLPAGTGQRRRKQYSARLSILVEELPIRDTTQQLWSMADRLIDSQVADRTLGQQLDAGPLVCDMQGVIRWTDQTLGRGMVVSIQVESLR